MKKNVILLLGLLFLIPKIQAQDEKFKALFMYNFTKYIEWPANKRNGDFIIGIWGKSPVKDEIAIIAEKKTVGSQKIVVKEINSIEGCQACHMIYIPEKYSEDIKSIVDQLKNKGVVIITDKQGMAQTVSGINYVKKDGKQLFEINKKHLDDQGVKVNSSLLSLGIVVE